MLTCHDVANYFLALVDEDAGDTISNMKLQKLVYYAQGFYLALYGKPLFPERIEAWDQGPVIPELYRRFEKFGAKAIEKPEEVDFSKFDSQTRGTTGGPARALPPPCPAAAGNRQAAAGCAPGIHEYFPAAFYGAGGKPSAPRKIS